MAAKLFKMYISCNPPSTETFETYESWANIHWNRNISIFVKFSSGTAPQVVKSANSSEVRDENFVKLTFPFRCLLKIDLRLRQNDLVLSAPLWPRIMSTISLWMRIMQIPAWISNHMPSKVWDEIINPFPNFNGCTVEVWEWISNFTPHFIMDLITYPCWD